MCRRVFGRGGINVSDRITLAGEKEAHVPNPTGGRVFDLHVSQHHCHAPSDALRWAFYTFDAYAHSLRHTINSALTESMTSTRTPQWFASFNSSIFFLPDASSWKRLVYVCFLVFTIFCRMPNYAHFAPIACGLTVISSTIRTPRCKSIERCTSEIVRANLSRKVLVDIHYNRCRHLVNGIREESTNSFGCQQCSVNHYYIYSRYS